MSWKLNAEQKCWLRLQGLRLVLWLAMTPKAQQEQASFMSRNVGYNIIQRIPMKHLLCKQGPPIWFQKPIASWTWSRFHEQPATAPTSASPIPQPAFGLECQKRHLHHLVPQLRFAPQ